MTTMSIFMNVQTNHLAAGQAYKAAMTLLGTRVRGPKSTAATRRQANSILDALMAKRNRLNTLTASTLSDSQFAQVIAAEAAITDGDALTQYLVYTFR